MIVSLLPYDLTDSTGIAANKNVTITWSSQSWRNWGSLMAPTTRTPAATSAPDAAGAKALAAGALAVAAIASTLY